MHYLFSGHRLRDDGCYCSQARSVGLHYFSIQVYRIAGVLVMLLLDTCGKEMPHVNERHAGVSRFLLIICNQGVTLLQAITTPTVMCTSFQSLHIL